MCGVSSLSSDYTTCYTMKRAITVLLLFVTLFLSISAQESTEQGAAKIGDVVPDFSLAILDGDEASLYDLDYDIIILDFWATWCGPCIDGLPKMKEIEDTTDGRVKVLAITSEKESRIKSFLSLQQHDLTFVLDTTRSINDYFPHATVPHYVILDKAKRVKAITHGKHVTVENITKLLNNEEVDIPMKKEKLGFNSDVSLSGSGDSHVYQSILSHYHEGWPSMSQVQVGNDDELPRVFISNLTAGAMIPIAYQMPRARVLEELTDPDQFDFGNKANVFCYELVVPKTKKDQLFDYMKSDIVKFFDLNIYKEVRTVPVIVLKKDPSTGIELKESTSEAASDQFIRYGQGLTLVNDKLTKLTGFLEEILGRPVIDETDLKGNYDLDIKVFYSDLQLIPEELAKYGLKLEKKERAVEMLIVKD